MIRTLCMPWLLAAAVVGGSTACERQDAGQPDPVAAEPTTPADVVVADELKPEANRPAQVTPDYAKRDLEITAFLDRYYRQSRMFEDDELRFNVSRGVVTATGALDSRAEIDALRDWVRAIPSVAAVNLDGVRINPDAGK